MLHRPVRWWAGHRQMTPLRPEVGADRQEVYVIGFAMLAAVFLFLGPPQAHAKETVEYTLKCRCGGALPDYPNWKHCDSGSVIEAKVKSTSQSSEHLTKRFASTCSDRLMSATGVKCHRTRCESEVVSHSPSMPGEEDVETVEANCSSTENQPNEVLDNPQPSTQYAVTGTTFTFKTDAEGRTIRVTGVLKPDLVEDMETANARCARQPASQRRVGHACQEEGRAMECDGGHLIASEFGGPGESVNMVPMERSANQGAYGRWRDGVEGQWMQHLQEGHEVGVFLELAYSGKSKVPHKITGLFEVREPSGKVVDSEAVEFNNR